MTDQARFGPEGGGGAMGDGDIPARSVASATPGMREQAKDSVRDARHQLETQVRDRTRSAKEGADRMLTQRKQTLAESVGAIATAFDAAAGTLSERDEGRLAGWTRELSDRTRRLASYLEEHDTRGMVTDLEGTAREHPAVFAGGTFAAGLAAGRFLRASTRDDGRTEAPQLAYGEGGMEEDFGEVRTVASRSGSVGSDRTTPSDRTTSSDRTQAGYGNSGTGFGTTGAAVGMTRSAGPSHISTGGPALASQAAGSAPSTGAPPSTGTEVEDDSRRADARREPSSDVEREGGVS